MVSLRVNVTDITDNLKRVAPSPFSLLDRSSLNFMMTHLMNLRFVQAIVRALQKELHHLIDLIFIQMFDTLLKGIHTLDVG